jgi:hypothetical protein
VYPHFNINSWHLDVAGQRLVSGGNNWLQRRFTTPEPYSMSISDDGVIGLTRDRDGKIIDGITLENMQAIVYPPLM